MHYHARDMAVVRGHIAKIPVVLSSATPSLETEVNARRGRYARLSLPERFGGQRMPSVEAIDLRTERAAARPLHRADARRRDQDRARAQRAGAALPQSPRLRAADAVPRLRLSLLLPELRRLAGRSPLPPHARLPPLRLRHAASGQLPEMPGGEFLRRRRAGRRAARRGSARIVSAGARAGAVVRSRRLGRAHARGIRRRRRRQASTSSSARSSSPRAITSRCSIWSASSTPISASPTAIRAPPSAPSSCLHQVVGRAGRDAGVGHGYLQTHQPEHPVMRALIAQDREAFYSAEIAAREDRALPAVRPARFDRRLRPRQARHRRLCPRARPRRAGATTRCACSAPPKRRSRWCAAGTGCGC